MMHESLRGRRVLVTGSSTGIGAEIARRFAANAAWVGIHYRGNRTEAERVAEECRRTASGVALFQADLLEADARRTLVPRFVEASGGIDVLINNAGAIYEYRPFSDVSEEAFDSTFALNVKAPFCLMRSAFEHMGATGRGRIINISTTATKYGGGPNNFHYAAAKAALDCLTMGFAREGARRGILVNAIRCGLIRSPMQAKIPGYVEEKLASRIALVPVGRAGEASDVAAMALLLASDDGAFITGQLISVSGGE